MKRILRKGFSVILAVLLVLSTLPAAIADGMPIIGTVTVTANNYLNVREGGSTSYARITTIPTGSSYPVLSIAQSGWYEILLPDGRTGYVSNNLVDFTAGYQPPGGTIPVYYRTVDGRLLYTDYVRGRVGVNEIYANASLVPSGYQLQGLGKVSVSVDSSGNAVPAAVLFLYSAGGAAPTTAPLNHAAVEIRYVDNYGNLLKTSTVYLRAGSHLLYANTNGLPSGYQIIGAKDRVVSVSAQLVANPSTIIFTASGAGYVPTVPSNVPQVIVNYQTTNGVWLNTEYVNLSSGYNIVYANDSLVPEGYSRYSSSSISVYVDNYGKPTPSSVTFQYQPKAAQEMVVSVPVYYRSASGETLAVDYVSCKQGNNTIYANNNKVPSGYVLQSQRSVPVYISYNGTASPSSVVFTYALPVNASVSVIYQDNVGNYLNSQIVTVGIGSHTIYANSSMVPKGYTRISADSASVYVDANGNVSPSGLVFVYAPQGAITEAPKPPTPTDTPKPYVVPTMPPETVAPIITNPPAPSGKDYNIPAHKTGSISSEYAVYSGPGTEYYRAANGRANVKGGRCRFYGLDGDWAMMGYQYQDDYRIGYIQSSGVPSGVSLSQLNFMYEPVTIVQDANFNDDPILSPSKIGVISKGTTVSLLGFFGERWAYIETTLEGEPARGFVNRARIGR
ncbi:MAG: SH3 domain-containing protein [Christensenellales bacterium]